MKNIDIAGWGRLPVVAGKLCEPSTTKEITEAWRSFPPRISRGLGRSYGDASLPISAGFAFSGASQNRLLSFDENKGILKAEAGVSLAEIIEIFLPRGWFPVVVPGTKFVTLGGAVAADIHGKNHHVDGSFGAHVIAFDLLLPDGCRLVCSAVDNPDIFRATIGGMGLTGHILCVTLRLRRVSSAWCKVRTLHGRNLEHSLALLAQHDQAYRHTVAWMDCLAGGDELGRGVLMLGNEATPADLPSDIRAIPHRMPARRKLRVPFVFPSWALGPFSVGLFNRCYYGLTRETEKLVDFEKFFSRWTPFKTGIEYMADVASPSSKFFSLMLPPKQDCVPAWLPSAVPGRRPSWRCSSAQARRMTSRCRSWMPATPWLWTCPDRPRCSLRLWQNWTRFSLPSEGKSILLRMPAFHRV